MADFVHLHVHSYYSFMRGLCSPKELVSAAADAGMKALAITDIGICGAFPKFVTECQEKGIKPILGSEMLIVKDKSIKDAEVTAELATQDGLIVARATAYLRILQRS